MKLLLRNHQSPGDVLMLTAAVRDLHRAHPGTYQTAVDTTCMELWDNNPLVSAADALPAPDRVIECQYPLIHHANRRPFHFLHAFAQDLERQLDVSIPVGAFRGDIYLSQEDRQSPSPLEAFGHAGPYWVMIAGGKYDFTTKWWDPAYAQAVVDHFAGKIKFVQCGAADDWHPHLRHVIDLVGRTNIREFIRVLYHAQGVICPVTFAMHLAAALPPAPGGPAIKPCVVIAGGREPPHWEAYPGHQFLHTVGALPCCASGGCWKSRCQLVGDGDLKDDHRCELPVAVADGLHIGKCMTMITPQKVIDAVMTYYDGGVLSFADGSESQSRQTRSIHPHVQMHGDGVGVTVGVGAYAQMAKLAAREVEARCGLRTVVLDDGDFIASRLESPMFLKFRIFDLVDAENIFYFDADMVPLEDWQPQQFFGDDAVVAVRDRMLDFVRREAILWGVPAEEHFNAGMFIVNRKRDSGWLAQAEAMRFSVPTRLHDQLPLNAARYRNKVPLKLLDRRYNWLGFGDSSLSHRMPVVMAHKLAPGRHDVNVAYFEGKYELFEPDITLNLEQARRLSGKGFVFLDEEGNRSTIRLREDWTITPAPGDEHAGYWFVHDIQRRPTLALASDRTIMHQFVEALGGVWISAKTDTSQRDGARLIEVSDTNPRAINEDNARAIADRCMKTVPPYPKGKFDGKGIVICGGGQYFPCAWVCMRMLRRMGCQLPIELWQMNAAELDDEQREMVTPLGVTCVNAADLPLNGAGPIVNGWALKPFAVLHSSFTEVMLIDADNVAVRDPAYLFDAEPYRQSGACFWPDFGRLAPDRAIWRICGIPYRDEPEFETGQLLVHKERCWRALHLTMHMNEQNDFYYNYIYGDKDTFHMAWTILNQPYAMVPKPIHPLKYTMCQHDFEGRRIFQHRNFAKWMLEGPNPRIDGFHYEEECLQYLQELAGQLSARA